MSDDYICAVCETHSVEHGENAALILRGQLHPDTDEGGALFVLEPGAQLEIIQLNNGQLALRVEPSDDVHVVEAACMEAFVTDRASMDGADLSYEIMHDEAEGYL